MAKITNAAAIAMIDAFADLVDAGTTDPQGAMVFYDGTPPATAETALSGNNVLGTIEFNTPPAYGAGADAAPGGRATLNGTPLTDSAIDVDGTNTFARTFDRDNNVVAQYEEGTDYTVNSDAFQQDAELELSSHSITQPES